MGKQGKGKGKEKGSKNTEIKTMEEYKAKGKGINEKYCVFTEVSPIMLPPAPKQTYIDLYVDDQGASSSKFENEKRLQANYEAEVKVYRALERLEEEILVLHGFDYSHHQYRLCVTSHDKTSCIKCKKNAANREGECDFIVIGKNYIVIIEVKNIPHEGDDRMTEEKRREISGAFDKAQKQQENVKSLVDGLLEQVFGVGGTQNCSILSFSAFPSSEHISFENMDEKQKQKLICKEDFMDLNKWWCQNVIEKTTSSDKQKLKKSTFQNTSNTLNQFTAVREVLLAIWCTEKNRFNELKCSLGKCIKDIGEELRKGMITFCSKNRLANPNVIKVTDIAAANVDSKTNIFRDFIGVDYLTAEQLDAFNRDQNLLVINGPAGSGKTIILLAKLIQLMKRNAENRAVLFIFSENDNSCKRCQDTLKYANVSNKVVVCDTFIFRHGLLFDIDIISQTISRSKEEHQVVIARIGWSLRIQFDEILYELIGSDIHVFIDDCQAKLYQNVTNGSELLHSCQRLSESNMVHTTCDLTQREYHHILRLTDKRLTSFIREAYPDTVVNLSLNLRNTSDIAGVLIKIREQFIEEYIREEIYDIDVIVPTLRPGHWIHGPRTVVHVIIDKGRNDLSLIDGILNKELNKLCIKSVTGGFIIGIVTHRVGRASDLIDKIIEERSCESDQKIEKCHIDSSYSVEYPVVIVVHCESHNTDAGDIPALYLEISRARVYCVFILSISGIQSINNLLDKLEDEVKIVRH